MVSHDEALHDKAWHSVAWCGVGYLLLLVVALGGWSVFLSITAVGSDRGKADHFKSLNGRFRVGI